MSPRACAAERETGSVGRTRGLARALNRILRDGWGSSSMVERFDVVSALLLLHALGVEGGADEWRRAARRAARDRPGLTAFDDGAIPLADATLEACIARLRAAGPGAGERAGPAYEELLRDTFDKGQNQQFFTPRRVVRFMVELVADRLSGTVADPACGTGGLLVEAARRAGPDVEAVGVEVDGRLARAARMNMHLAGVRNWRIHHLEGAGALGPQVPGRLGAFDVVITNPPFGSDTTDREALDALELGRGRRSRRRGVLFLERCLELVRPGGTVCIVLEQNVVAGRSQADARRLVLAAADVEAVVELPARTFQPYASVRTSILVLRRRARRAGGETFFARAVGMGGRNGDGTPRAADGRGGARDDLVAIAEFWRRGGRCREGVDCYRARLGPDDLAEHGARLDFRFHHPARRRAAERLARSPHEVVPLGELCEVRNESIRPSADVGAPLFAYVGLSDIEPHTGRVRPRMVPPASVRGPVLRFEPGDVLFSRLRPELRKCCLVDGAAGGGHVSSECLVLAVRGGRDGRPVVEPALLAELLRSDLVLDQLARHVTGIGRPRLSRAAVLAARLPVPPPAEQRRLLDELHERLSAARRDRALALEELERAACSERRARRDLIARLLGDAGSRSRERWAGGRAALPGRGR
jgi:predicted RNA methylase